MYNCLENIEILPILGIAMMFVCWIRLLFASFDEERIEALRALSYRAYRLLEITPNIPRSAYMKATQREIITGIQKVEGKEAQIG